VANVILNGGSLWVSTLNGATTITNTIVLGTSGGGLLDRGETWNAVHFTGKITGSGPLQFAGSTRGTYIEAVNNDWSGGLFVSGMEWVYIASNSTIGSGPVCISFGSGTSYNNNSHLYLLGNRNVATNQIITMLARDSLLILAAAAPQLGSVEGNGAIQLGMGGTYNTVHVAATTGLDNRDADYYGDIIQYYYPELSCSLIKAGAGTWSLWGNVWLSGAVMVSNGTLRVNNYLDTNAVVSVCPGAALDGIGTVGVVSNLGGTVKGCLYLRQLAMNSASTLAATLGGTNACTQYSQLNVTDGVVTLGNSALSLALTYVPVPGQRFTILSNAGAAAVAGQFAQGRIASATYNGKAYFFSVNYAGGDGNDIVLTALPHGTLLYIN
jgi:autotransporter-associated beta strand protein